MFGAAVSKMRTTKGISMVELLLVLFLMSLIILMVTRYYQTASRNQKVNEAQAQMNTLISAASNWRTGRTGYDDTTSGDLKMATLIDEGLVPKEMGGTAKDGTKTNPWGGNVTITAAGANGFTINFTAVDSKDCLALKEMYVNSSNITAAAGEEPCSFSYSD